MQIAYHISTDGAVVVAAAGKLRLHAKDVTTIDHQLNT